MPTASSHFDREDPWHPKCPPWLSVRSNSSTLIFPPPTGSPRRARVATATIVAVVASLLADAALVAIGTAVFPSTHGYVHFAFADYARLTVLGVVVACLAWPVVTRVSSAPRWLYLRLAVAVTLILWIPDLWILAKGQPPEAVAVLMVMHLAIAVMHLQLRRAHRQGDEAGNGHVAGVLRLATGMWRRTLRRPSLTAVRGGRAFSLATKG